ncbi:hypothetical protein QZJ86_08265 [Methylomonas montana]|uniref:hypothetical protein n=1 Tax=Methylomonas montana TaxID=3058963 RepID=UPI00265A5BC9|nr:hypothetical protein [Methylomonas montana]WKJ92120.1 hypothetical protein QZJ86_08265 [Methylomonas montana]
MKTVKRQGYQWAAAICVVASINTAQAAINNGGLAIQALGSGSAGEMFLNVWDQAAATSYSIDLGTTVESFLAGKQASTSWNLDQRFVDWASLTSDPLTFNVAGNNSYVGVNDADFGVLMSRRTGSSAPGGIAMTTLATWGNKVMARANALNINQDAQNGDASNTDFPLNLSEVTTNNISSYFNNTWGASMNIAGWVGSAVVRNGETPDQTVNFFFVHSPGGAVAGGTPAVFDKLGGFLSLDVANAKLNWTSTAAPVPVPGAVWLFLSGMLAVLRVQKRSGFSSAV